MHKSATNAEALYIPLPRHGMQLSDISDLRNHSLHRSRRTRSCLLNVVVQKRHAIDLASAEWGVPPTLSARGTSTPRI